MMKTLTAAAILLLSTSAAMAEAPCQSPQTPSCQKACAVMGAKFVLSMRKNTPPSHVQTVRTAAPGDAEDSLEGAQRLARLAGLSLDYIEAMTVRDVNRGVAKSCPR
jgi:hypothetical protein